MHAILLYFLNLFRPYPQKMTVLFLQRKLFVLRRSQREEAKPMKSSVMQRLLCPLHYLERNAGMIRVPWRRLFGKSVSIKAFL